MDYGNTHGDNQALSGRLIGPDGFLGGQADYYAKVRMDEIGPSLQRSGLEAQLELPPCGCAKFHGADSHRTLGPRYHQRR